MLAVHGLWSVHRGLVLWAEDSEPPVTSRSEAVRSARPHPFAAAAGSITDALPELDQGTADVATLLLPSTRRSPVDSPELVRLRPRRETQPSLLLPWTVPVVCVDPATALSVLELPVAEARYGASMRYLTEVVTMARDLAERGRVLPAVEPGTDGDLPCARWRPILQGPDAVAVHALSAAMPPVCRAEATGPHDTTGQRPTEPVSYTHLRAHET